MKFPAKMKSALTLYWLLTGFVIIFGYVPFAPLMPEAGLDPSWRFVLNQAVADHLVFGKDVIFTFGPYGSLFTGVYHPATATLMLAGSLFLAVSYLLLLKSTAGKAALSALFFSIFALLLVKWPDVFFLSYPLLFGIHVFKHARTENTGENSFPLARTVLFSTTMGLLPAVKGTFLLECVAVCGLCSLFLAYRRHYAAAAVIALTPALSLAFFWVMAGQPLDALPGFLINIKPIISGYSEAMALHGGTIQVVFYAITAAALTRSAQKNGKDRTDRLYLAAIYGVFLFICFKAAFVRHDIHALTGSSAVMLAALSLAFLHEKRTGAVLFILPLITWALIYVYFVSASPREPGLPGHLQSLEHQAAGLAHRLGGSSHLDADFRNSVARIKERLDLPVLPGSSDIYFDDQSDLIASGNHWAPRPVFQSYSAYTPGLSAGNVGHLQGSNAPDNLFVLLNRAVDDRLPSLADGPSWIPMLEEYHVAAANRKFVILQRNTQDTPYALKEIGQGEHSFYESIDLPEIDGPLWMEADIRKTVIGRITSVLFKPSELTIRISLAYGPVFECRFIPSMARSKFLISPLVATTSDFAALAANDPRFMHNARIKSIEIFPSRGSTPSWSYRYSVRFYAVSKEPLPSP